MGAQTSDVDVGVVGRVIPVLGWTPASGPAILPLLVPALSVSPSIPDSLLSFSY